MNNIGRRLMYAGLLALFAVAIPLVAVIFYWLGATFGPERVGLFVWGGVIIVALIAGWIIGGDDFYPFAPMPPASSMRSRRRDE